MQHIHAGAGIDLCLIFDLRSAASVRCAELCLFGVQSCAATNVNANVNVQRTRVKRTGTTERPDAQQQNINIHQSIHVLDLFRCRYSCRRDYSKHDKITQIFSEMRWFRNKREAFYHPWPGVQLNCCRWRNPPPTTPSSTPRQQPLIIQCQRTALTRTQMDVQA